VAIIALLAVVLAAGAGTAIGQDSVMNPDNGHHYALVLSECIAWPDAYQQAVKTNVNDCVGYLATVTSAQENQFLIDNFGEQIGTSGYGFWLGGYQDPGVEPPDYGWQWVTGEPWSHTNWSPGEPNDVDGPASEQHLDVLGNDFGVGVWNDEEYLPNIRGYIVECEPGVHVQIDVKPGSYPNSINLDSRGTVPVALLTTEGFDASTVDPITVRFANAHPLRWAMEDVDHDGDLDLLFHFNTVGLILNMETTEATLTGRTFGDVLVWGTDTVNIVP
jgi:hypothetical protein